MYTSQKNKVRTKLVGQRYTSEEKNYGKERYKLSMDFPLCYGTNI
jgi:hypothetical protein